MNSPAEGSTRRFSVRLLDEVDAADWEELLARDRRATCFHRPSWSARWARHHARARARFLEARDAEGSLRAALPFVRDRRWGLDRLVSGAGGVYGGPMAGAEDAAAEAVLVASFRAQGGARVIGRELVWAGEEPPRGGGALSPLEAAVLLLPERPEQVDDELLGRTRRKECRRNERRGLRVEGPADPSHLDAFLPLYEAQARRWGVPPVAGGLLRELLEDEPHAHLFVARRGERILGAHVVFELPGELFAWLGTTERVEDLFPSVSLVRAEARWAVGRGLRRLNLGSSLGLQGVARHKELLGAQVSRRWILRERAGLGALWGRKGGAA